MRQLKKLTNLVYLDVSHNNLTDLAVYTFAPLNRLTVLDLSGNDLADLSDKVFDSSIHPQLPLVHLRLAETGLASLNQLFLPQLVVLNVSGNECDPPFLFVCFFSARGVATPRKRGSRPRVREPIDGEASAQDREHRELVGSRPPKNGGGSRPRVRKPIDGEASAQDREHPVGLEQPLR